MNTQTKKYGLHLILDCYGANPHKLEDIGLIFETLNALPGLIGMKKIGFPQLAQFKEKEIAGVSGIIMIVESHISLHTYSKKDFLSMDVYSCRHFEHGPLIEYVKNVFGVKEMEMSLIERGKNFPARNLHD